VPTGLGRSAVIDLDALLSNARALTSSLANSSVDVRADAYGHGLSRVAKALADQGVGQFLVSTHDDVAALARLGISATASISSGAPESLGKPLGLGVYGLARDGLAGDAALRPTMRLTGEVISVKTVPAGSGVSYGYTYRTTETTRLALIALGFADGIPRVASNRAPVRIRKFTGRITGRVAMDQFVVDVGAEEVEVGDRAVLFGDARLGEPTVAAWSSSVGIAPEVILARIGARVARSYSSGDSAGPEFATAASR
jgi:alanine racemase